jgi:hypothetical protein
MAASAAVDVVGTSPISFTDSTGAQKSVPLSALTFSGSKPDIADDWAPEFTKAADKTTVLAIAAARIAAGELTPPPTRPPSPAIVVTAVQPGPESNNIVVAVTVKPGPNPSQPLSTTLKFRATETDTYTGLRTATEAAEAIGVETSPGTAPAGAGLVMIKSGSVATADTLPVDQSPPLTPTGFDVKDANSVILFSLVPARPVPSASGSLSVDVRQDPSGTTFTVSATYASSAESPVTIPTLNALPLQVAYLVTVSAPSGGAMLPPVASPPVQLQLSGGGPGMAASGLFYT